MPFLLVLWDFGVRPLRRATEAGINGDFFDIQGRALLDGRLDVPPGSLGIEAFVVDGHHHMYFGPFPALLRIPVLLVTDRLDGRLTAPSMLAAWLVLAVATVALVDRVRRQLRGSAPVGRVEAVAVAAVVATVTGGSTVVFLASVPWVYHEVYAWSTALAVATVAALAAAADDPLTRRVVATGGLALATMLTRATAGWSVALAVMAVGGWLIASRGFGDRARRRGGAGLVAAGAITLLAGSLLNWAKFHHPYRFPIADQVWSALSPRRQLALAANGGDLDGLRFVPTTLRAYLRPDGIRFTTTFPFVTPPADPPAPVGGVLLDESWRTGSVPALMPLLVVLAAWGVVVVVRSRGWWAMRLALLGCAAISTAVLAFAHVAPRYTSEFVPLVAVGAVVGVIDLARRLGDARVAVRRAALAGLCALAAYGIAAHVAIGAVNARLHWGGDRLADLVGIQLDVGSGADGRVVRVGRLPARGPADQLAVVGDCDAVYLGTGEMLRPWVAVAHRDRRFRVDVGGAGIGSDVATLLTFAGAAERRLLVEYDGDRIRLVLDGGGRVAPGRWLAVRPGDTVDVTLVGDSAARRFEATATVASSGASAISVPMTEWDRELVSVPVVPGAAAAEVGAAGLRVTTVSTPRPDVCALGDRWERT